MSCFCSALFVRFIHIVWGCHLFLLIYNLQYLKSYFDLYPESGGLPLPSLLNRGRLSLQKANGLASHYLLRGDSKVIVRSSFFSSILSTHFSFFYQWLSFLAFIKIQMPEPFLGCWCSAWVEPQGHRYWPKSSEATARMVDRFKLEFNFQLISKISVISPV